MQMLSLGLPDMSTPLASYIGDPDGQFDCSQYDWLSEMTFWLFKSKKNFHMQVFYIIVMSLLLINNVSLLTCYHETCTDLSKIP